MALETAPASSQSDGRWRITSVPLGANALSVAILNGGTAKAETYSFTPDGFNWATAQATVPDKRLTLKQDLSRPGKTTETLELKYVASTDANSAAQTLTEGSTGQFNVRRGVPNETTYAVGQTADVITYILGAQRPDAPTENGLDTISQTAYITAPTVRGGTIVA
ncbi:hypothetical protein B7R21_06320 [Subtercola boreus]|uniref:Uncharacterized protein n=1 Tax=Subtercola boreus TaxID=120213 RepID=A0A3E0W0G6_9MICO|nr:hypothetical protein [Subtercola boreus]RFA14557.1 hypothetical protein B7R21_06320 [Subtercola boreus]